MVPDPAPSPAPNPSPAPPPAGGDPSPAGGDPSPPAPEPDDPEAPEPPDPAEGETVPADRHRDVVRESRKRKAKIRTLEEENKRLREGKEPTERELSLQRERDAARAELAKLGLRHSLSGLTDGLEGRPKRTSDRVLDLMAADAAEEGVEAEDLKDFVGDFVSGNPKLFEAPPAAPPPSPAVLPHPTAVTRRADEPSGLNPAEELAAYNKLTPEERRAFEARNPGVRAKMQKLTTTAIVNDLRRGVRPDGTS